MSSDDHVIDVRGLGKRYWVGGHLRADYMGMHALLERAIRTPFRLLSRSLADVAVPEAGREREGHLHWALRDLSFAVERGEVLGIVGHNGAGKSVLLKILSRVTRPTEGRAWVRGRVGSMLEAGAGFHHELTGRENVFLAGAILGMRQSEIVAKFDEIVAFSGIEDYLDTPVKRYSSGMRLRLGFAIAAHLDADIMLVDEVLAVGDESFRRLCTEKMRSVASSGRTVLFVSHELEILKRLCDRALLLRAGRILMDDSPERVVERYLRDGDAGADPRAIEG